MDTQTKKATTLKGGEWLIKESNPLDTFITEDFSEEQKMMYDTSVQFVKTEVLPNLERMNNLEPGFMPSLLKKAGDLGLMGASVPEQYGGLGKDFVASTIINEGLGAGYSFSVAFTAHTGIGLNAHIYFGTESKRKNIFLNL